MIVSSAYRLNGGDLPVRGTEEEYDQEIGSVRVDPWCRWMGRGDITC